MNEQQRTDDHAPARVPMIDAPLASSINRGELDSQIATAHAFPRSIKRFLSEAFDLITLNEEVASECIFSVPRDGKLIRGASVRFAEILHARYGNCRVSSYVVDEGKEFVTARGIFHDLESNAATAVDVKRRITDKRGRRYSADMIVTTCNAATSIASRQAILKGIPKAVWQSLYDAAEKTIAGNNKPLEERRATALAHFKRLGVAPDRVFAALGVAGIEELGNDELLTLQGLRQSIKDSELTIETAFPPLTPQAAPAATRTDQVKRMLGAGSKESPAEGKPVPQTIPDDAGAELAPEVDESTGELFERPPTEEPPK